MSEKVMVFKISDGVGGEAYFEHDDNVMTVVTGFVDYAEPNQKRINEVIRVARFESRMEGHARCQARVTACSSLRPERSSSLRRSKMRMFASKAPPVESIRPAMPGRVRVTGMNLKRARVIQGLSKSITS